MSLPYPAEEKEALFNDFWNEAHDKPTAFVERDLIRLKIM
jgi:hypothetical protein